MNLSTIRRCFLVAIECKEEAVLGIALYQFGDIINFIDINQLD